MPVDRNRFPFLPERIEGLAEVATNVSWSWKRDARRVFQMLDDSLWHLTRHNPIAILRRVDPGRLSDCARDPRFLAVYDDMMSEYRREQEWNHTWFAQEHADLSRERPVAYFCAEFGLHNSVPIYSGGLGVLAGDHCKAASDLGVPLVGVGLFYMLFRLGETLGQTTKTIEHTEAELLPVIHKGGETLDRVNRELDKVDVATDSALAAVQAADTAVRTVTGAVTYPVTKFAGLIAGLRGGVSSFVSGRNIDDAMSTARDAAAQREHDLADEVSAADRP